MNLSRQFPSHLDLQSPSIYQNESDKRGSAKSILSIALSVVIAGAAFSTPIASPVLASSENQAEAKETSAIDPHAMDDSIIWGSTFAP